MPATTVRGVRLLAGEADAPALIAPDRSVSYGELAALVTARIAELGTERRLVFLTMSAHIEPIVTYLAALEAGHPVLLLAPGATDQADALIARFDPDVVAAGATDEFELRWHHATPRHHLHPDLAMLATTSGSSGTPKLVRLSQRNVDSNAHAIGEYLGLTAADRAITALPLHYCYGLSVLNSHLAVGASVVLTDASVSDERFWDLAAAHRITSLAGVPYTFDLLDAAGFWERSIPSLRYLTQAGGRLAPERVRRYAELGAERGVDLFVMYGQTEATARMAFLPPALACTAAGAIGQPIPGGCLRIDRPNEHGVGEVCYSGPNVMMGYADAPADLARGRDIHELRTGDLGRCRDDALFEIVGRASRFAKVHGVRRDLDALERGALEAGISVTLASDDTALYGFVGSDREASLAHPVLCRLASLPPHAVRCLPLDALPRTESGKVDYPALLRYAREVDALRRGDDRPAGASDGAAAAIRTRFAAILGRANITDDDTFTSLGGDSLSYIEASVQLERVLGPGRRPADWPARSIRELAARAAPAMSTIYPASASLTSSMPNVESVATERPAKRPTWAHLESSIVIRTLAIILISGTHAGAFVLQGGAHTLLAVAGFNLARFGLIDGEGRARRMFGSIARIAIPAVVLIALFTALGAGYDLRTMLLVQSFAPDIATFNTQSRFWFIEVLVWSNLAIAVLIAVSAVSRLERRGPLRFAWAVFGVALLARVISEQVMLEPSNRMAVLGAAWFIALGWVIAKSQTRLQRAAASLAAVVTVWGFFDNPQREAIVIGLVLVLTWVPTIPVPGAFRGAIVKVITVIANASLFIYLLNFQVLLAFGPDIRWLKAVVMIAAGVALWLAYTRLLGWLRRHRADAADLRHERSHRI
ncbi:MAG TPA: AMP-binding protein [Candidatus Lumbricidophila sp.]|nr:AMP-binding protein [Candidatus Lumbricidophila sp.]